MIFKKGDIVSHLHESGQYTIVEVRISSCLLLDEFGFELDVPISFIVPRRKIQTDIIQKDEPTHSKKTIVTKDEVPELDLHIEALVKNSNGWSAHDKLLFQLDSFKRFANEMIDKRKKKFRIVHGAGEGRLKNEIRLLIQGKKGFTMHDDQYSNGRIGASLIEMQLSVVELF